MSGRRDNLDKRKSGQDRADIMRKKKPKLSKQGSLKIKKLTKKDGKKVFNRHYEYFARLGWAIFCGFQAGMSHPYIRLDMAPEFDNLLIVTFGRAVYQFLNSKKGQELWDIRKKGYSKKEFDEIAEYFAGLAKTERHLPNIFDK